MARTQINENQEVPDTIADSNVASNAAIQLSKLGTGNLTLQNQGSVIFKEQTGNGIDSVTIEAPDDVTTSYTLKLPLAQSSGAQVLTNDGSGNLSWSTGSGSGTVNSGTAGRLSLYATSTNAVSDIYVQNTKNITLAIAAQGSRTQDLALTIPNPGNAVTVANMVLDQGNYTIAGTWSFSNDITLVSSKKLVLTDNSTDTVSLKATNSTTSYTLSLPTTAGTANYFLQTDGSGNATWAQGGGVGYREDYVVGTPLNNYTGSTTIFNLVNSYNVGGHTLVVTLDGDVQTIGASVDYLETNSTTVTFNNALIVGQKVSFIFSQPPTSPSGIVNSGMQYQLGYYALGGTTISGLTAITASRAVVSDASGLPTASSVTTTELGYVSGVTSAIQTQLGNKLANNADASMNSHKITGLTAGATTGDAISWGQAFTSGAITFSPTTTGIVGTTAADDAAAGKVGEYISAYANGVNVPAASTHWGDATSFAVTAGDWDVTLFGEFLPNGATVSDLQYGVNTVSGDNSPTVGVNYVEDMRIGNSMPMCVSRWRLSTASSATVYMKIKASYSGATPVIYGTISVRRVR